MAALKLPKLIDPSGFLSKDSRLQDPSGLSSDAVVSQPFYPLDSAPDAFAKRLTQLLYGQPVHILKEEDGWCKIVALMDGYVGWVPRQALKLQAFTATHRVSAPLTHIFIEPDIRSRSVIALPMNALITPTGEVSEDGSLAKLMNGRWVPTSHIRALSDVEDDPFMVALRFTAMPYQWGGCTALGVDCSALVQLSLFACGMQVLRDSDMQFESLGKPIDKAELQQGDLVFFPGHVGIMASETDLLHANATNMAVTIDPLENVLKQIAAETGKAPYLGAKRLTL